MKTRILVTAFWGVMLVLSIAFLISRSYTRRDEYIVDQLERFQLRAQATAENLESFSRYTLGSFNDDQTVSTLVARAWAASDDERDVIREELYRYMLPYYERMNEFRFRQVHFHFPDTTSFLRMHRPDRFGDYLGNVRHTVRIANEEHQVVSGFEEGRIFNGYRFVYPLSYDGEHVGTVEISYSMDSFLQILEGIAPGAFIFVMRRDVVDTTVFPEQRDNYEESMVSPDLVIDRTIPAPAGVQRILVPLTSRIESRLEEGGSFGFFISSTPEENLVLFNAISNVQNEVVAYIISIAEDDTYREIRRQTAGMSVAIVLGFVLLGVFSWIIVLDREKLSSLARTDQLTGAFNRYVLVETLNRELDRAQRYGTPVSIVILDIDHFKRLNDQYGHNEGDRVLKATATRIANVIRKSDVLTRWGGEEFIVVACNTILEDAVVMAEKIRTAITSSPLTDESEITVSLGVAQYHTGESLESLLHRADNALYRSKAAGRNRTTRE